MKIKDHMFGLLLSGVIFTIVLTSCENDHENLSNLTTLKGASGMSYNESFSKWSELKSKNGNSYVYQTTFSSWTGSGSTTELKIVDGIVTSRIYHEFKTSGTNGQREVVASYSESTVDLGSHNNGAKPLTIDELYNSCANEFLIVDENENTLYFETELNGLMTLCGFVPNECADDCYRGIRISSFSWID